MIVSLPIMIWQKRCSYCVTNTKEVKMISVLENVKDREQVSSGDEDSYVSDEQVD